MWLEDLKYIWWESGSIDVDDNDVGDNDVDDNDVGDKDKWMI